MRKRSFRWVGIFLSFVIFFTGLPFFLTPSIGMFDAHMVIKPCKVGSKASYQFIFSIDQAWEVHDDIVLIWPPGTNIDPPIPREANAKKQRLTQIIESISIGLIPCNACQGLPVIEKLKDRSIRMVIKSHVAIDPTIPGYNPVVITVPDSCGFINPTREGFYTYSVATESEPEGIACEPVEIVESRLGEPEGIPMVVVDPSTTSLPASYTITFRVGRGGWLRKGMGMIKLIFPEDTKIPTPGLISPKHISVNDVPLLRSPNGVKQNLNFPVPVEIDNAGLVTIQISKEAGLTNPNISGDYWIEVATSSDPEWVPSEPYSIGDMPLFLQVKPPIIGRIAEYSLIWTQQKAIIKPEDSIDLLFPEDCSLPTLIESQYVLVNKESCNLVTVMDRIISIQTNQQILPGQTVELRLLVEAGIRNPSYPLKINLSCLCPGFNEFQPTNMVEIIPKTLEIVKLTITPKKANTLALYEIQLIFGTNQEPTQGDLIIVWIPFLESPIIIEVSEDLSSLYTIQLPDILNPDPGEYQLMVSTTRETDPVSSPLFTIDP